jgi:hypothetical protein
LTLYLLPLQTPGCRGRLPWANLPKQKEPPHRGDIGWGRFLLRQFDLYPLAYDLNYKLSDNNDYSRKTWVYLLKSKDEVFSKFKEFKALIENLSERKIKILRPDNGGEYTLLPPYTHLGDVEEIFNPIGVSLGTSES